MLAGQYTGWNLLASEQFPLGGYETVRGYEERAFNADSGILTSLEIATPGLSFYCKDLFEMLAFIDYGWGKLHKPFPRQKQQQWLLGYGMGIRYSYKPRISLRGDVGFPANRNGLQRHGAHYYGGATVSF